MNVYLRFFIILFMASLFKQGYGSTYSESCSKESREQDEMCGKYCYKVVKPLLSYAASVRSKEEQFGELENKIKDQEITIIKLQHQCALPPFADLQNKINELEKTIKLIEHEHQQHRASYDEQITKLKLEHNANFKEINYLKSSSISSNCLGKATGVNMFYLPNIGTFSAPCDIELAGSGWTVVQRRVDGSVDFNRNWEEYKAGFGDLRGEFFLGLEKLHLLTQFEPHELYIHLEDFDNKTAYAKYNHFLIGNEAESYELKKLGDYSGNAGDSLIEHINLKFSTEDQDNDNSETNCAKYYKSGWWFSKCYNCNLNGQHTKDSGLPSLRISWNSWHHEAIKFVQMMIRPKSH